MGTGLLSPPSASVSPLREAPGSTLPDSDLHLPTPENRIYYPALDGLRAIAVLMVFNQHYLYTVESSFLAWGWTGVDLFFVLSGFLITGILYDTRHALHRFRTFYIRRTLRIFPLYYSVLLASLLLLPIFHWRLLKAHALWPLYLGNYTHFFSSHSYRGYSSTDNLISTIPFRHPFLLGFAHFWSLCVEEQFYLVWPLVVFTVRDRIRLRNLCLAGCVVCLAARVAGYLFLPQQYVALQILYRATPFRADALLLGSALALALRGPEAPRLKRLALPAFRTFVVGFAAFQVVWWLTLHHLYSPDLVLPGLSTIGFTLVDVFAAIIVLLALTPGNFLYRLFLLKPLCRLGQVSYGFYVFHDVPHNAYSYLARLLVGYSETRLVIVTAILALVCTLALSFLSFRYFEAPFLRLKQRFAPA